MVETSKIVCVYGALRSGTTMLRLMLDSHPQVSCPGESDFIFSYLTIENGVWSLDTDGLQRDWLFQTSKLTLIDGSPQEQVAALIAQSGRGREWTVLVVHRDLGRVLDVLPDLRIIHLLRDPRDVARSAIGMGWAGNVYFGVRQWVDTEDSWSSAMPRMQGNPRLEVHYEDLVRNPEARLEQLCAFLDVPFDRSMLTYDQRSTYALPDVGMLDQWRRRLCPRDIGLLEARLGDRLQTRGYQSSGHRLITPTLWDKLALTLDNKAGIWRKRFRDFGVVDPITVTMANRLRLPGLGRRAQQRIEQKIIAKVK